MVSKVPIKQLGSFTASILSNVTCDSGVYQGALVRLDSSFIFVNSIANSPVNAEVFGICVLKSSPTVCDILLPGGITDSIYVGLLAETKYFLSPSVAGAMTTTVPTGSGQIVLNVGQAYNSSRFLLNPLLPLRRAL
jgi:hypothetical protein